MENARRSGRVQEPVDYSATRVHIGNGVTLVVDNNEIKNVRGGFGGLCQGRERADVPLGGHGGSKSSRRGRGSELESAEDAAELIAAKEESRLRWGPPAQDRHVGISTIMVLSACSDASALATVTLLALLHPCSSQLLLAHSLLAV